MMMYGLKPVPFMLKPMPSTLKSMRFMLKSACVDCRDGYRFVNGEDCGQDCFLGSSSPFAALRGGKLLEAFMAR